MTQHISPRNIRIQTLALVVGLMLMAAKFLAWWLTNSNAILSDALESIINIVAGAFALYSLILANKPSDREHPYGHGKIEFISAGFEGALILLAGVAIIIKGGYNLIHPQIIQQLDIGIVLTLAAGAVNFGLGFILEKKGHMANSLTMIASGKHLKSDAYTSLGLLLGLLAVWLTRLPMLDNIVAMIFGLIIIMTGRRLLRKSVAGIMDEADMELIQKIVAKLNDQRRENWIDVHNFRVIKYGATLHFDCHLTTPWYFNTRQAHTEVKRLERFIDDNCDTPVELFIHVDPCDAPFCRICIKNDCPVRQHPFEKRIEWTLENVVRNQHHAAR